MGSDFYDAAFAADLARLRDPAWTEPDADLARQVQARIAAFADELADQLSTRVQGLPADAPDDASLVVRDAGDWHLARLRALREIRTAIDQLADRTVAAAGIRGAGYPQVGDAWAITRQGARKKWPHAVSATSPPPAGQEPRTTITAFGGSVDLSWRGREGGWWWIGEGADGTTGDAGEGEGSIFDTREEAAANAGAFLQQHALPSTNGNPQ
ncbi:hypothetical protein ACFYUJ_37080 [Streptomyces sp. NPDC004520]|uniref:hypothetical protein n=1 Tax=Streptomyces sp. NPDC004520 TaxID=3364702 RepID=UPI00369D1262